MRKSTNLSWPDERREFPQRPWPGNRQPLWRQFARTREAGVTDTTMKNTVRTLLLSALLGAALCPLATPPAAAQNVERLARSLSLQDCWLLALKHNFDVQIQRLAPVIDQYNLNGAYGAWDPTYSFSAQQRYNAFLGGFNSQTGLQPPPSESYDEIFGTGLTGLAPSGLTYSLSGNLDRNSGTSISVGPDGSIVARDRGFQYQPSLGLQMRQPLLKNFWTDQARMNIQVNKRLLKIDEQVLRGQIINTVTLVQQAYYDLIYAYENVKVQQKALELAQRLLAENKKRVEVGAMAPLDEKSAESQAAISRAALLGAQQSLATQQNTLKNLIIDDYSNWHDVEVQPAEKLMPQPALFDLQASWQNGLTQRADLLQARLDMERRNIVLRYQYNQLFPQLDLFGTYGRNGLERTLVPSLDQIDDNQAPNWSYGASVSIPLSNRTARNAYKATKAAKQQALLQLKQLEQTIMVQIDNGIKVAQASYEQLDATRQAREFAQAALEAEQKKLENGKSTSYQVLLLQRDLTQRSSDEIQALAQYNKALAALAQAEGTTLEKNQLTVEVRP